jgi:hypothetical protein
MLTVIPRRYDSPKWQAPVAEPQTFVFKNNVSARTLFELKQALTLIPDDTFYYHVSETKNDFADWVKSVVGDEILAQELRHQNHRWGMIVALERHLMRTLNLPPYVAKRWLSPAISPFTFLTGEAADSLPSLAGALEKVSDDTVAFHLERIPNDIAKWVMEAIGDYQLAEVLADSSTRLQMLRAVEDHLTMLNEASS